MLARRKHLDRRLSMVFVIGLLSSTTGCALFENTASKPIRHKTSQSATGTDIIAIGAERRVVYSQSADANRKVCSEPPPDVAQSFSDSLRASLAASIQKDGGGEKKADLSIARDFATAVSQIYTRSQGVQLFRDGSFMLCQAHLNRALAGDEFPKDEAKAIADARNARNDRLGIKAAPVTPEAVIIEMTSARNYSERFSELLKSAENVLKKEIQYLYKFDIKNAEENAARAAAAAKASENAASASKAAAGDSERIAESARRDAANSASDASAAKSKAEEAAKKAENAAESCKNCPP